LRGPLRRVSYRLDSSEDLPLSKGAILPLRLKRLLIDASVCFVVFEHHIGCQCRYAVSGNENNERKDHSLPILVSLKKIQTMESFIAAGTIADEQSFGVVVEFMSPSMLCSCEYLLKG
jgi:hypothetical protein